MIELLSERSLYPDRTVTVIRAVYAYRDLGQHRVEGTERKARSVDILTQTNLAQEKYQHRLHALLLLSTGYQP